ncbi:hypothetical protein ACF0H5_007221 [Mactra antiquata]
MNVEQNAQRVGVQGSHLEQECPRHRGLPDGFARSENVYKPSNRPVFRLDLRSALKGYIPNKVYKFRVQTTVRKFKFNDATVVFDPVDGNCGAGNWLLESDLLYSPDGCPSVVTTQQKKPMGRAYFVWKAPSCGCVHFRVRVHANLTYFIEDERVHNGPLAKTVCPKPGTVIEPEVTTTVVPKKQVTLQSLTLDEKLYLLCDTVKTNNYDDVIKNPYFKSRRRLSNLNHFEQERLETAVQVRHQDISTCCHVMDRPKRSECFGDIRRQLIDDYCGSDDTPDIPIAEESHDWMIRMKPDCCSRIGERRYQCFEEPGYNPLMPNDVDTDHIEHKEKLQDDFNPVSFLKDYGSSSDIIQKYLAKKSYSQEEEDINSKKNHDSENTENDNGLVTNNLDVNENNKEVQFGKKRPKVVDNGNLEELENDDDNDDDDNDDNDSDEFDDDGDDDVVKDEGGDLRRNPKQKAVSEKSHPDYDRVLSTEECCMNGIDTGTELHLDSHVYEGCFKVADMYKNFFRNWSQNCDRHFVICCMRVIDGYYKVDEDTKSFKPHNNTLRVNIFVNGYNNPIDLSKTPIEVNTYPIDVNKIPIDKNKIPIDVNKIPIDVNKIPIDVNKRKFKRKHLIRKQRKHKHQNMILKSSLNFDDSDQNAYTHPIRHNKSIDFDFKTFKTRRLQKDKLQTPMKKSSISIKHTNKSKLKKLEKKMYSYWKQNSLFKHNDSHLILG